MTSSSPAAPDPRAAEAAAVAHGQRDSWQELRAHTAARIALGRAGESRCARSRCSNSRLAHAGARDAVLAPFDVDLPGRDLSRPRPCDPTGLATAAPGPEDLPPSAGFGPPTAAPESAEGLRTAAPAWGPARSRHPRLRRPGGRRHRDRRQKPSRNLPGSLTAAGWTLYSHLPRSSFARVKLQRCRRATLLQPRHSVVLLGERPGLSAHDSLGAYPHVRAAGRPHRRPAQLRPRISRPEGLPPIAAAQKLAGLLLESRRLGLSGTALRDGGGRLTGPQRSDRLQARPPHSRVPPQSRSPAPPPPARPPRPASA